MARPSAGGYCRHVERTTATVDAPAHAEAKAPLSGAAALPQHVLALQRAAGNA